MPTLRDKIVVIAFLAVAALPLAAKLAHVRDHKIDGAIAKTPHPELSLDGIRDESYQTAYRAWFENTLRLKGYAIFADNTVLYHVLRDAKTGSTVRIGSDRVLFVDADIGHYNRDTVPFDPVTLDAFVTRVADLQTKLRAQHRAFVPVIIPSKTTIYPDMVPARWTRDLGTPRPSEATYLTMKRALDAHHITYVDARELLVTSSEPRPMLWGATGRHWTVYGACLALQQIAHRFTELTGRTLDYDCRPTLVEVPSIDADYDLMSLLNAWGIPHDRLVPRATHEPAAAGAPLSVMFVGTSFCRQLVLDAEISHRFTKVYLDYYNATLTGPGPDHVDSPVEPHTPAWRDVFLSQDLYVLDLFESYYGATDSFIDHFLDELGSELR
jgi:hypothetical protein